MLEHHLQVSRIKTQARVSRRWTALAIGLAAVIVGWLVFNLFTNWADFAMLMDPKLAGG